MKNKSLLLLSSLVCLSGGFLHSVSATAQDGSVPRSHQWTTHFGIQSDIHYTTSPNHGRSRLMGGTYLSGVIQSKHLEFGARIEELSHPLPGHEMEKGWGIPYLYLKGRYRSAELTLGDLYEQFGSGSLLRSYEDRSLGLDNSIRGGRIAYSYKDILSVKALAGQQRNHFDRGWHIYTSSRGYLAGGDMELGLENIWHGLKSGDWMIHLGGSYVHKYEAQDNVLNTHNGGTLNKLVQPEGVSGWSGRLTVGHGNLNVNAEYAYKTSDPNTLNNYIYRSGSLAMLSISYLWGSSSLYMGARRSENFDFRSDRKAPLNDMRINFLQPFVKQQTYTLAALYPYATRPNGEWSLQAEYSNRLGKGSALGGKYGTSVKVFGAIVHDLKRKWSNPEWERNQQDPSIMGTDGYTTNFWEMGQRLFHNIGIEISKKVSPVYSFVFSYMNQSYHQQLIEGHAVNNDIIHSNIFVYDGKHKLSKEITLRTEFQYLISPDAYKDWAYGLIECSLAPHFIFSISDLWNVGTTKQHYYMYSVAGLYKQHRLQLSYGRTREGINCSGGVCRMMPETNGLYLSYNLNL